MYEKELIETLREIAGSLAKIVVAIEKETT